MSVREYHRAKKGEIPCGECRQYRPRPAPGVRDLHRTAWCMLWEGTVGKRMTCRMATEKPKKDRT